MNEENKKKYMTLTEAANFLGYKKSYMYKLIHLRKIPHMKYGGRIVCFDPLALQEWKEARIQVIPTSNQLQERAKQYCLAHPQH